MSQQRERRIVREVHDEPHIKGRRITVRDIHRRVEHQDLDPQTVADRFDLDIADVYRALTYYHDHPDEMRQVEAEYQEAVEESRRKASEHRPDHVSPDSDE